MRENFHNIIHMSKYILAHRGILSLGENSFEGLMGIKDYKNTDSVTYGIEFDVQQISSGTIICYHDDNILRLCNVDKDVCALTDDDVEMYKISYLKDILNEFIGTNYILNIEIKSYNLSIDDKERLAAAINSLIVDTDLNSNCIVSCFDIEIIKYMLSNYPCITSIFLIDDDISDVVLDELIDMGMEGVGIYKEHYVKADIYLLKGLRLMVYTFFDDVDRYEDDEDILRNLSNYDDIYYITDKINDITNF